MVMPGDNTTIDIELITPVPIEAGLRFNIREGGRTVGTGIVTKVLGQTWKLGETEMGKGRSVNILNID